MDEKASENKDGHETLFGTILQQAVVTKKEWSFKEYQRERQERWQALLQVQAEGRADYEELCARKQKALLSPPAAVQCSEEEDEEDSAYNARLLSEGIGVFQCKEPPTEWMQQLGNQMELLKQDRQNQEFNLRLLNPSADSTTRPEREFFPHPVNLCQLMREMQPKKPLKQLLTPATDWNAIVRCERVITLGKKMINLLHQNCAANFKVTTDYTTLFCHPMLLSVLSGYFVDKVQQVELYLPPCIVSTESFVRAYRWLLEPLRALKLSQLLALARTAGFMDIKDLREQCWFELDTLMKRYGLIYTIYIMAKKECINLQKQMIPYLANIFLPFAASTEYLELNYEQVFVLFKVHHIAVNSEMEILYALLMWLDHDWEQRERHAIELFKFVHLDMMPLRFLLCLLKRTDCPPALDLVCSDIDTKLYEIVTELKTKPYKDKGDITNKRRQWIYDPGCKYHHCNACDAARFATYSDFLDYLDYLQETGYPSDKRIKPADDPSIVCCRCSQ